MKSVLLSTILFFAALGMVWAQMEIPAPSPKAKVTQRVGVTDITIEYSSPGVKGRQIWGGLEPYGQVWRTGANAPTTIEFSKDVTIQGTKVPAGKYSLLTIPGEDEWTVMINKDLGAGEEDYDEAKDVVRVQVKPEEIPHRERMTFILSNFDDTKSDVDLEWDEVRVRFPVQVNTEAQAFASIEEELGHTWREYANAARYTLTTDKNQDKGIVWINRSIELKNDWYNNYIKAQLLKEQGEIKEAYKVLQATKELGDEAENFFYKEQVEKDLEEWKDEM